MCPSSLTSSPVLAERVVQEAAKLVGTPFRHFGRTRHGLDCSGLIYLAHNRAGKDLPQTDGRAYQPNWFEFGHQERLLEALDRFFVRVTEGDPQPGDILLFRCYRGNPLVTHAGICLGWPRFVHARSGSRVEITTVEHRFWQPKYAGFMRLRELV